MEALHDVVKAGKARYLGASSMWAWRFAKMQHAAERHGWTRFISMQDQYSLLAREEEREMFGLLADQGVGSHPVEPAGRRQGHPAVGRDRLRALAEQPVDRHVRPPAVAGAATRRSSTPSSGSREERGVSMATVAMAWVLKQPRRRRTDRRRHQAPPPRRRGRRDSIVQLLADGAEIGALEASALHAAPAHVLQRCIEGATP